MNYEVKRTVHCYVRSTINAVGAKTGEQRREIPYPSIFFG